MADSMVHARHNSLIQLHKLGQSVWLEGLRRALVTSGELHDLIIHDGISGIICKLEMFDSVISGSSDYDESIQVLARQGRSAEHIFSHLVVQDVQMAADSALRTVFDNSKGLDGYVCVDIPPYSVFSGDDLVADAGRYFQAIGRKNVMVNLPATESGIAAIEHLLAQGVNINATAIFDVETYKQVVEAYLSGLEKIVRRGGSLGHISSVASFSVAAVGRAVDGALRQLAESGFSEPLRTSGLFGVDSKLRQSAESDSAVRGQVDVILGAAALAGARAAYQVYLDAFADEANERWKLLVAKGAKPQRLVWVDTAGYDPFFPETVFVEELVGRQTIIAMTPSTANSFRREGIVRPTLEGRAGDILDLRNRLWNLGLSLLEICDRLRENAIDRLTEAADHAVAAIKWKRDVLAAGTESIGMSYSLGRHDPHVSSELSTWGGESLAKRLWQMNAHLWPGRRADSLHEVEESWLAQQASISGPVREEPQWLGWLNIVERQLTNQSLFDGLTQEIRSEQCQHLLLLGAGSGCLAVETIKRTFGRIDPYPEVVVLDSTVPAQVLAIERHLDLARTLCVVVNKSGTALETTVLCRYFLEKIAAATGGNAAARFAAITDPGSPLERLAWELGFKRIFYGIASISEPFAALSELALIPAAMAGVDVGYLLKRADAMVKACASCVPLRENTGIVLGVIIGVLARHGLNKLTVIASFDIEPLGAWLEQIMAQSTGKQGCGVVPVTGEEPGEPHVYGNDRLFVYLRLISRPDCRQDQVVAALEKAGHPVIRIDIQDPTELGAEFFRWQMASAVAASVLGVKPFEAPEAQLGKDYIEKFLEDYRSGKSLPEGELLVDEDGIRLFADDANARELKAAAPAGHLSALLDAHIGRLQTGDYFAINAFVEANPQIDELLNKIRTHVRNERRVATMLGYGPRYLLSTGQLQKGGPDSGVFLEITCDDREDVPVPGEPYTLGMIKRAQALADFTVLNERRRRLLRVHVGADVAQGLEVVVQALGCASL